MLNINTILVPIDFSKKSHSAAEHAVALGMHFDAGVLLLHVIPSAPTEYRMFSEGRAERDLAVEEADVRAKLEDLIRDVAPGCDCRALVERGDPAHQIERVVSEHHVDLVVLPTQGHGLFRRLLLGSVTAKVLHDVDVPVLTGVHLEERPPFTSGPYRRIACAIGLRERQHSEKALRWAADLARSWSAELHVIHVPPAIDWEAGEWFPDETQQLVRAASQERLAGRIEQVSCQSTIHIQGMATVPCTVEVNPEHTIDALVIGRSVSHGIFGRLGANAFALIREATCPVFSV